MILKPHILAMLALTLAAVASAQDTSAQTSSSSPDVAAYDIVERGEDYSVYRGVRAAIDQSGGTMAKTNQFALLENCLNYFEDGQWKESQDVIEAAPDGAVARRGPNKAIFSPDLNSPAVFDILTSDGQRLSGGVRALQFTDVASGRRVTLASVKTSVPGELLPPSQIVYRDAFDGLDADVLLVWRHNSFSQDVVIREQPALPDGLNPDTTRLEVVTEIVEAPKPDLRKQTVQAGKAGEPDDDVVIHFGRLAFVKGTAYPMKDDPAWAMGGLGASDDGSPVVKQWHTAPDGRTFLIESIGWSEAQANMKGLASATQARATPVHEAKATLARVWPGRPASPASIRPIEVAQLSYQPKGYVVDFIILPDNPLTTTFATAQTYYVKTSYSSGSAVTFQPGCYIKFKNNAYMLLYGSVNFPNAPPNAVFTSRDDDLFGQRILGVAGESGFDSDPTDHLANPALWIYYVTFPTTIRNAQFRWASTGVRYDSNPGVNVTHSIQNSLFQECATGVYVSANSKVSLTSVQRCDVTTPTSVGVKVFL